MLWGILAEMLEPLEGEYLHIVRASTRAKAVRLVKETLNPKAKWSIKVKKIQLKGKEEIVMSGGTICEVEY